MSIQSRRRNIFIAERLLFVIGPRIGNRRLRNTIRSVLLIAAAAFGVSGDGTESLVNDVIDQEVRTYD